MLEGEGEDGLLSFRPFLVAKAAIGSVVMSAFFSTNMVPLLPLIKEVER